MGLKVFVRDIAITISVKGSEYLEGAWLTLAEGCIFDLREKTSQPARGRLITDIASSILRSQLSVDKGRGWVSALLRG